MPIVESELALLRDPRLAALATSAWPAWLWSADGSRHAVGECRRRGDLWRRRYAPNACSAASTPTNPAAAQIIRLAARCRRPAQERLERLRGFGAGFGRALTCACSRIVLADGTAAVLVAATEPAGPALPLARARAPAVRRWRRAARGVCAGRRAGSRQRGGAAPARRRNHAVGARHRGARREGARSRQRQRHGAHRRRRDALEVIGDVLGSERAAVPVARRRPQAGTHDAAPAAQPVASNAAAAPPGAAIAGDRRSRQPSANRSDTARSRSCERRHPLRFVWQMDADGRFVVGSDEFIELVGPRTMAAFGRPWSEIAAELKLDPDNQVARAVASRETWSGIVISWPVDECQRAAAGRTVGPSGVRSRPQLSRLSRLRRLPRR